MLLPDGRALSPIALGCMRIARMAPSEVLRLTETALDSGVSFFDHADIYGDGRSETVFGEALRQKPSLRNQMILQSKCGIRKGICYDSSKAHILSSVDGILKRLGTDRLDILLIHRPDMLANPYDMAEAFETLRSAGKVLYFGVSNHSAAQIALLQSACKDKLLFNQMQMSLLHTPLLDQGINVNLSNDAACDRGGDLLPYMAQQGIVLQTWSPFQYGFMQGVFLDNPQFPEANQALSDIAPQYGLSPAALCVAWLLRLPLAVQVILGTTRAERIVDAAAAANVSLSREDWYALYRAAGNRLP